MKIFFLSIFILLSANADYFLRTTDAESNTITSYCINDYYYKSNKIFISLSENNNTKKIKLNQLSDYSIKSGYKYTDGECNLISLKLSEFSADDTLLMTHKNLNFLGLADNDLSLVMALSGLLCSGLFLFGIFRLI